MKNKINKRKKNLWAGRFKDIPADNMTTLNASIKFDSREVILSKFCVLLMFIAEELVASNSKVYPLNKSLIVLVDLVIAIPSTVKDASVPSTVWVRFLVDAVYEKLLVNWVDEPPLGVTLNSLEAPLFPFITKT